MGDMAVTLSPVASSRWVNLNTGASQVTYEIDGVLIEYAAVCFGSMV